MNAGAEGRRTAWGKFLAMTLGGQVTGGKVRVMISGAAPLPSHVHSFLVAAMGCDVIQGYDGHEPDSLAHASPNVLFPASLPAPEELVPRHRASV